MTLLPYHPQWFGVKSQPLWSCFLLSKFEVATWFIRLVTRRGIVGGRGFFRRAAIHQLARCLPANRLGVLPNQHVRTARSDAVQKIPAAKIPVFQPQIAGLCQLDESGKQAAFLRMTVATKNRMRDEIPARLEHHQREAGKRCGVLFAQRFDAAVGGGDFVSVNGAEAIARNKFGHRRLDFAEDLDHIFGGFTDEGFGDGNFDAGDFVVQGIDGERKFLVPGFVGGVNFRSNFTGKSVCHQRSITKVRISHSATLFVGPICGLQCSLSFCGSHCSSSFCVGSSMNKK